MYLLRVADQTLCTINDDSISWLDDRHTFFKVIVTAVWTQETKQIINRNFMNKGVMPPEYINFTQAVNDFYIYTMLQDRLWYYYLAGISFHDATGKMLNRESFEDSYPQPVSNEDRIGYTVFEYAKKFLGIK